MRIDQQELHLWWNLSSFLATTSHSALIILIGFTGNSLARFPLSLVLCVLEEKTNVGAFLGESLKASGWSARPRIYAGVIGP